MSCSSCSCKSKATRVVVTGGAGQIGYSLCTLIASGHLLGLDRRIRLHVLDVEQCKDGLKGLLMELTDMASSVLEETITTTDPAEAFDQVDIALLCGAFPRLKGMERKDLLSKNAAIFKSMGENIEKYASRDVKVVVVGNPANTNCYITRHFAPSIPAENFSALTRLDHNRARAQVAALLHKSVSAVSNVIIWGNHSSTQYPDIRFSVVRCPRSNMVFPALPSLPHGTYNRDELIKTVQTRGAAVIDIRKASSAASAAFAICDHARDWVLGTKDGEVVSMAVVSDGSYGVEKGLVFSYPVRCKDGKYHIIQGLEIDEFSREKLTLTETELREERDTAMSFFTTSA